MGNANLYFKVPKMTFTSPVVVILGCTGTGKSKLAIELAKKFNGEIISADSMQVYKGLDIITNKVTSKEQLEAIHHFISCTDPLSRYTVVDFRNKAIPLIDSLLKKNKLPIIVGGTNYYIESLLWDILLKPLDSSSDNQLLFEKDKSFKIIDPANMPQEKPTVEQLLKHNITQESVSCISNEALHEMLKSIDPAMANSLHPQDRRKVIRSLQVYQQHSCRHSDLLTSQRSQKGGSALGGPLRYTNSIMLWLQCEKEVLEKRLDQRIEEMLEAGLINELLNFHRLYNEKRVDSVSKPNYNEGIFQSIGFKEFHDFLVISKEERDSEIGKENYQTGVEQMRLVTKQYAKKQIKWIKNRFLRNPNRQVPPIYGLNATDIDLWEKNVLELATHIVQSTINNDVPNVAALPIEEKPTDVKTTYFCDVCNQLILGQRTWEAHINSRKHSRRKSKAIKRMQNSSHGDKDNVQTTSQ